VLAEAERTPVIDQRLAVRAEFARSPQQVEILMGEVAEERNPYSGATMLRRLDVRRAQRMWEYGTFATTDTEVAPAAYILLPTPPQALNLVLSRLEAHGLRTTRVESARSIQGETFRIDSTSVARTEFQGHRERRVDGAWVAATVSIPAGAVIVSLDQPLGRLAFTLLEPRSDDGFVNWNFYDAVIEASRSVPILRVHQPLR
jgi:hypothetical protein